MATRANLDHDDRGLCPAAHDAGQRGLATAAAKAREGVNFRETPSFLGTGQWSPVVSSCLLVEVSGIEPLTSCMPYRPGFYQTQWLTRFSSKTPGVFSPLSIKQLRLSGRSVLDTFPGFLTGQVIADERSPLVEAGCSA